MGLTTIELFRAGNATSPRMDHVRSKDIGMFVDARGVDWVSSGTGGISTFAAPGPSDSKWCRLDPGYDYGRMLLVWNDHGQHWQWEPIHDMPLSTYRILLVQSHSSFRRI